VIVGITYDLRDDYIVRGFSEEETAEFDSPETIAAIDETLSSLGFETRRIGNIRMLVGRLAAGERWDIVFNIAEGLSGFGREAQIPALLEAWDIPYVFSDPLVLSVTLHKPTAKRLVRDFGIPTPDFEVVESLDDARAVNLDFPLFVKPIAEGTGKGISTASKINNKEQLINVCSKLLRKFAQPVLVESYLPGREFTVGLIGTGSEADVPGVMEVYFTDQAKHSIYSYQVKEQWHGRIEYRLADGESARKAAQTALAVWSALGGRDAGRVDLRADADGNPSFLEVNPLAGLRPGHSDLPILCELAGMSYKEMIDRIMRSALRRIKQKK